MGGLPRGGRGHSVDDEVRGYAAEETAEDASDVDEAGVVAPEVGGCGEKGGTDGGDCYEAAEEAAVAGRGGGG